MNKTKETNSEGYKCLEKPIGTKNIRMPLKDLKRFCRVNKRPFFVLNVEETVHGSVSFPVDKPWREYFTLMHGWVLWATEEIEDKGE